MGGKTYVLLAGSITSLLGALPALGNAAQRGVSGNVVGASAGSANAVGVAADDDVAAHAVGSVGLGARHLVGALGRSLGADESGGDGDDDGRGLHFVCCFAFCAVLKIKRA